MTMENDIAPVPEGHHRRDIELICNHPEEMVYYKTYDNHQITAVDLNKENLDGVSLIIYPLIDEAQINFVN